MNDRQVEIGMTHTPGSADPAKAPKQLVIAPAAWRAEEPQTAPSGPNLQTAQTVQIICADSRLACEYQAALDRGLEPTPSSVVTSPDEACEIFAHAQPLVTLLDESALPAADSLEPAMALLVEAAPVVVVAAPERHRELSFFITSGAADFVPRCGPFVSVATARVERRVRLAALAADLPFHSLQDFASGFGEILRHELNNQLTGVLGNAELLLGRRDRLPSDAIERLETMRQLAIRLRETVRRLSQAWDLWQHRTQPPVPSREPVAPTALRSGPSTVTTLSMNSAAPRSATALASAPKTPAPRTGRAPRSPETPNDAIGARSDKMSRNRKE
jgi:His Kinase A (phospho-acceptor) domain